MANECFLRNFEEVIPTFRKVGTKPNLKPFQMDVAVYNNLIAMFCEKGKLSEEETMFVELFSNHY